MGFSSSPSSSRGPAWTGRERTYAAMGTLPGKYEGERVEAVPDRNLQHGENRRRTRREERRGGEGGQWEGSGAVDQRSAWRF